MRRLRRIAPPDVGETSNCSHGKVLPTVHLHLGQQLGASVVWFRFAALHAPAHLLAQITHVLPSYPGYSHQDAAELRAYAAPSYNISMSLFYVRRQPHYYYCSPVIDARKPEHVRTRGLAIALRTIYNSSTPIPRDRRGLRLDHVFPHIIDADNVYKWYNQDIEQAKTICPKTQRELRLLCCRQSAMHERTTFLSALSNKRQ
ncbi:hypothetical protein BST61_g3405 [Cercospora zeina]